MRAVRRRDPADSDVMKTGRSQCNGQMSGALGAILPIGPKERDWENPKALGLLAPSPESEIDCSSFHAAVQQVTIQATSQAQFLPGRMAELTSIPVILPWLMLAESNQWNHVEYLESLARIGLVLRSERLQPQAL